jgi:hypothetical protein
MAQTPDLTRRTENTLKYTAAMLEDLLEGADHWDARSEDERLDFVLDWEEMMQRVEDLASGRYASEVSTDQQAQLRGHIFVSSRNGSRAPEPLLCGSVWTSLTWGTC